MRREFITVGNHTVNIRDIVEISGVIEEADFYLYRVTLANKDTLVGLCSRDKEEVVRHREEFIKEFYYCVEDEQQPKKVIELNGFMCRVGAINMVSKVVKDYPDTDKYTFTVYFNTATNYITVRSDNKEEIEAKYAEVIQAMENV